MRRRSERKKSTDVSSPAPPPVASSRRTSRRSRKSPSLAEADESNAVDAVVEETPSVAADVGGGGSVSEENSVAETNVVASRKSRNTRNRTPVGGEHGSPSKGSSRKTQHHAAIPEEENGATIVETIVEEDKEEVKEKEAVEIATIAQNSVSEEQHTQKSDRGETNEGDGQEETQASVAIAPEKLSKTPTDILELEIQAEEVEEGEVDNESERTIVKQLDKSKSAEKMPPVVSNQAQNEDSVDSEVPTQPPSIPEQKDHNKNGKVTDNSIAAREETAETPPLVAESQKSSALVPPPAYTDVIVAARTQRKRRWITKRATEACKTAPPIISISTDSLKNLIADVHPVPLSDIQLDSSSEVEEVASEREEGEETPSPEHHKRHTSIERKIESTKRRNSSSSNHNSNNKQMETITITTSGAGGGGGGGHVAAVTVMAPPSVQRSPSPARNQASQVLFITNLVRPFTVLQLKGLLARTGKIVENGFWIDRIKSKCYVQYETDDQAIETRHALHGVRWPVSNPKCLNVDFGVKANMERAIASTKDDGPKFGQDNQKDNVIIGGTGWNRERHEIDDKKGSRPVREWDVGKKESLDTDKKKDQEKHRSREHERERERERDNSGNRENEKIIKDRKDRRGREPKSRSLSPVRKIKKKENDPPLRLLDDLFRKTKATPCIYWLPLRPEQIAEKEAFRQKRIDEHKERVKQRELERGKDREKERDRRGSSRDKRRY